MPYIGNTTSDFSIDTGNITNRAVTATKLSPSSVGSNGQVLSVDGSGNLQWSTDSNAPEGTSVLSTGESGTTKYLRVDGDGTCSWQLAVDATKMPLAGGTFVGDVTFFGGATNVIIVYDASDNALEFWDSTKAVFGSSNYLEIKSDGTNGVINQVTNDLLIQTAGSSKVVLKADGKVGIGTTSPSAPLHLVGSDNNTVLLVESTDADASVGPIIELFRNSSSPADNDVLGRIDFKGEDDAGNASTFARIGVTALDVTNGTEDARIDFTAVTNDTFTSTMSITGGKVGIGTTSPEDLLHIKTGKIRIENAIVSNNDSTISYDNDTFLIDVDPNNVRGSSKFEIKIDTVAGLTIDDNRRVGIGTTSPASILHVESSSPSIRFVDTDASGGFGMVGVNNTSGSLVMRSDDGNSLANSYMGFEIDGGTKMYIKADGKVGIGTTSPSNDIHILKANAAGDVSLRITNDTNDNASTASLYFTTSPSVTFNTSYIQAVRDGGKLNFGYSTNTPTVCMQVSTEKVGIGETSPDCKLHVNAGGADDALKLESTDASVNLILTDSVCTSVIQQNNTTLMIGSDSANTTTGSIIAFYVDGTEQVRVADGIAFNGDTASGNFLNDYEEGTWTPGLHVQNLTGQSVQLMDGGKYTKIGNRVWGRAYIKITNIGSGASNTGAVYINGLPYAAGGGHHNAVVHYWSSLTENIDFITGTVQSGSNYMLIRRNTSAQSNISNMPYSALATNCTFIVSFAYDLVP